MLRLIFITLFTMMNLMASLVESGQNSCYDNNMLISCPLEGEDFYGQDAQVVQGAEQAFEVDRIKGTVYDANSKLTWQLYHPTTLKSYQSAQSYCSDLELANLDNWRVPSMKELMSTTNYAMLGSPLNSFFLEDSVGLTYIHWWSADAVSGANEQWALYKGGDDASTANAQATPVSLNQAHYIRCVNGESSSETYTVEADVNAEVVSDKSNLLMWQDSADVLEDRNWQEALAYCANSEHAGYSDWHLPNIKELATLASYKASSSVYAHFSYQNSSSLDWSSTTVTDSNKAWLMSFTNSSASTFKLKKTYDSKARCVRSIDPNAIVSLDVSGYEHDMLKTLSLKKGWNLVALPVKITITKEQYASYFGNYEKLYTFNNQTGWTNNPESLSAGEGFWIKMNSAKEVSFEGENYSIGDVIQALDVGWHLLGTGSSSVVAEFAELGEVTWSISEDTWVENAASIHSNSGFWLHKLDVNITTITVHSTSTPLPTFNENNDSLSLEANACQTQSETRLTCKSLILADVNAYTNKALFVADEYKGVIDSVQAASEGVVMTLRNAQTFDEVFNNVDIELNADEIVEQLNRSAHTIRGKYDAINQAPLRFSFKKVASTKRNVHGMSDDIILRIDFPKGYYFPAQTRSFDCDIFEASCDASLSVSAKKNVDLGDKATRNGITISTEGSYVEMGIGAYIRAKYDHNTLSKDEYKFELQHSSYFESNFIFNVNGKLEKSWSKNINITNVINVEIAHPYSAVAKLSIGIQPMVELGVTGELEGTMNAEAFSRRTGKMGFKYDSKIGKFDTKSDVIYSKKNSESIDFEAKVLSEAYILPRVGLRPKLTFLRVSKPLSFGEVRGGVKVGSQLKGEVKTGFVVVNEDFNAEMQKSEASLDLGVEAILDYAIQIRLGKTVFYSMDEYKPLYTSDRLVIFDWKIGLLPMPSIEIVFDDGESKQVKFSVNVEENADKVKYHVREMPEGSEKFEGSFIDFRENATEVDGDTMQVSGSPMLYVQAILNNADVSDSTWAFGSSISQVYSQGLDAESVAEAEEEKLAQENNETSGTPGGIPSLQPDETCDLWQIRYANYTGSDCTLHVDEDQRAKCYTLNECVRSIDCITWDQAQAELDACTVAYAE